MPAISKERAHYRALIASLSRDRAPDDPDLLDAKRKLRETGLAEAIRETTAMTPPLLPDQLDRLTLLLRSGGDVR